MARHNLFRAVVVSGAALTCQRRETGDGQSGAAAIASRQPSPNSVGADASPPRAVQDHNRAAALEPSAQPTSSETSAPSAAPAPSASAVASTSASTRARTLAPARIVVSATPKSRPCPPGSEMPFPPCYYIL